MTEAKDHARNTPALFAIPAITTILLLMAVPMLIAAVYSFMTPTPYGGVSRPFTTASYLRFVYSRDLDDTLILDPTYLWIFLRSGVQAALTTIVCGLIGLPLAWYIATRAGALRRVLILLVTIPFWTNLLIRLYCWVLLLRDHGLVNETLLNAGLIHSPFGFLYSDGAVLMGLVYSNLPFMTLPIYAALERVDPRLVEAAYDLYAGRGAVLRWLVVPLARPGLIAGAVLVFIPTIGAFLAPDILGGGKKLMIAGLIQQQFSTSRDWAFGAALSMILMAVVLAAMTFGAWRRAREIPT